MNILSFCKNGEFPDKFGETYRIAGFKADPARSRGPFTIYLLAERGFSYSDIEKLDNGTYEISQEEKEKLFEDFVEELKKHPTETQNNKEDHPNAAENCTIYGDWFRKGIDKIRDEMTPSKDSIRTPNDAYEYLNKFSAIRSFAKDIVQEYEDMWKNPKTSGPLMEAMGEEQMGIFTKMELIDSCIAGLKGFEAVGDKTKTMFYPTVMEFVNLVEGKKLSELDTTKLAALNYNIMLINTSLENFVKEDENEKNDTKYKEFLAGENKDLDLNEVRYTSFMSGKKLNLTEGMEEISEVAASTGESIFNNNGKDFTNRVKKDQIDELINAIPEEIAFWIDAPEEEKAAIHKLYINTANNLFEYYTNAVNHEMGAKNTDLIKIDGHSLSEIIDDKYKDMDLTPEQKKTAMEYEFASALIDDSRKMEYVPYKFDLKNKKIEASAPVKITQYDKTLTRTYDKSVDVLMDDNKEKKYGKSLYDILKAADDSYHKLYNDSNRLTDSKEFKRMLGSFKEIHELFTAINETGLAGEGQISDQVFDTIEQTHGYTKDMVAALLKETAKNSADYINEKDAAAKYRSSQKGNDRLMCAAGFLNDLDGKLTKQDFSNIKLKDSEGKKTVRENEKADNGKKKISFKDLMEEGEEARKNVVKKTDNSARISKKRMHERTMG